MVLFEVVRGGWTLRSNCDDVVVVDGYEDTAGAAAGAAGCDDDVGCGCGCGYEYPSKGYCSNKAYRDQNPSHYRRTWVKKRQTC